MKGLLLSLFCLSVAFPVQVFTQCINTFPYNEDFETSDGGWFATGTASDWAWGDPSKNIISNAGSGTKCWITGGLTASSYNLGERSYVQSPCFDFTNVQRPYVSLSIYWETESQYDGGNFQYSTDGGVTWGNIGYYGKPASCMNENWYNTPSVTNLAGMVNILEGWTGTSKNTQGSCQGGGGSQGWLTATQCMLGLRGISNVLFRMTFGAGTACNNYDGLAFDNITIGEAPANTADFTYTCNGSTVNFAGITAVCPDTLLWTFSDGGSAMGLNASHTFSSPGIYTVTLNATGPCNAPATITKQIEVLLVNTTTQPVSCNGYSDGVASVTVTPAGAYTYTWSTSPVQTTPTVTNLSAGQYGVTISSANACPTIATIDITEPAAIVSTLSSTPDTCTGGGGTAQVLTAGGATPYQYTWSNGAVNQDSLTNLSFGSYTLTTTDADGCTVSDSVNVAYLPGLEIVFTEVKNVSCYENGDGKISVIIDGGAVPYTYQWSNNEATPQITRLNEGIYAITTTDANGCSVSDSAAIEKEVCRSYVYFPTGFTPNGDGANDKFRPKYSADLLKYNVRVYNRWGELVYESNDINEGWDGFYKGLLQPLGVYVWISEYRFTDNELHNASGNITLMK